MPKEYPALMIENSGYAAILRGHGLPDDELKAAELSVIGKPEDGWSTEVEEVCFDYVPRVKWCSRHPLSGGWSCDQEGEWHGHWFEVRETDIEACHFTIIRHTDVDPDEVTGSTGPCSERYPDPADDVQCWLNAGHDGAHIVDGGTYRWSTPGSTEQDHANGSTDQ